MNSRGLIVAAVIIILIIIGIAVWGGHGGAKQASAEPIKIGVIGPFTGDAAVYGEPFRNMAQIAADEINAAGGVNGQQIQFVFEDGKCAGPDGANAAQKLVNVDKVQAIIGGFCSSETLSAVPVAETGKVVVFSPGATSPDLTGKSPYFFRDYPSDASQGKVLAEVSFNTKKWKKVAFIQEQLDYPLGIYKAFDSAFTALGGSTVKEEFQTSVTDFRSILSKLKAQNPDALFIDTQTPAAAERIVKQVTELGWKAPLLLSDAVIGDPATIQNNKVAFEGALGAEFGIDPSNTKFQHMLESYKAKYNTDAPYQSYMQTVYDSVYIIADGIKAVGYNGEKLAAWSRTIKDWPGASGMVTIGADGDRVGGHVAKVVHNGVVEILK